jgi:hypothetical protein
MDADLKADNAAKIHDPKSPRARSDCGRLRDGRHLREVFLAARRQIALNWGRPRIRARRFADLGRLPPEAQRLFSERRAKPLAR